MVLGSLCAERNAIGSALASDPTLHRRSLKMIGVLSVNLSEPETSSSCLSTSSQLGLKITKSTGAPTSIALEHTRMNASLTSFSRNALASSDSTNGFLKSSQPNKFGESNSLSSQKASPRKPKRPRTYSCDNQSIEIAEQFALASMKDRNPLAPCGACNEWLLKIAEANPSFKIVTFDTIACHNVYIHQLL